MRIAVAGTCRLALLIAQEIQESTSYQVVILSRIVSTTIPRLTASKDSIFLSVLTIPEPDRPHIPRIPVSSG